MTNQEFLDGKSFSLDGDWSKTTTYKYKGGAIKAALKKYEDSDTLNVITNSVVRSTPETMEHVLSLFY